MQAAIDEGVSVTARPKRSPNLLDYVPTRVPIARAKRGAWADRTTWPLTICPRSMAPPSHNGNVAPNEAWRDEALHTLAT